MQHRKRFVWGYTVFVLGTFCLVPLLGRDFFPPVDSGQIKIHVRAQVGTRIEETAKLFDQVEGRIREIIPKEELASVVDNIGLTVSGINTVYSNTGTIGPQDGDILITLSEDHKPTEPLLHQLRVHLSTEFPGVTFAFLPADIISQILNFGSPAPIDVQVITCFLYPFRSGFGFELQIMIAGAYFNLDAFGLGLAGIRLGLF